MYSFNIYSIFPCILPVHMWWPQPISTGASETQKFTVDVHLQPSFWGRRTATLQTNTMYEIWEQVQACHCGPSCIHGWIRSVSASVESALQMLRWSIFQKGLTEGPQICRNVLSHATERCVSEGLLLTKKWCHFANFREGEAWLWQTSQLLPK